MRRFFAAPENFVADSVILSDDESRHLRDVLRLRVGDEAAIFDGAEREFLGAVESVGRKTEAARLRIIKQIEPPALESNLKLTLGAALLKGEKFDLVVQKAVELGVTRVVPLITVRADVQIGNQQTALKKRERWQRIALEAAKQSGRAVVPLIDAAQHFADFIQVRHDETRILFAERGGVRLNEVLSNRINNLTVVVGAEGGWETAEIEAARRNEFAVVTLGGRILRAETAAIAVVAVTQYLVGDLA